MAFKLTKAEAHEGEAAAVALEAAWAALDVASVAFNSALVELRNELQLAIVDYNERLDDVRTLRDDVADRLYDETISKSEKWRESPAGGAAAELLEAWQALELDEIESDCPEDAGICDCGHAAAFRDLLGLES